MGLKTGSPGEWKEDKGHSAEGGHVNKKVLVLEAYEVQ